MNEPQHNEVSTVLLFAECIGILKYCKMMKFLPRLLLLMLLAFPTTIILKGKWKLLNK